MPKTTKKTNAKSKKSESSVRSTLLQIANTFFHNLLDQIQDGLRTRLNEFMQETKKVAVITFLIIIGTLFLFIGMANMIDSAIKVEGAGFLFMGFLLALIGFVLNLFNKKSS